MVRDYYKKKIEDKFLIRFLQEAEKQKKWSESWGAYFEKIYKYFCDIVLARTGLKFKVVTKTITSGDVLKMLKENHSFGLWLLKANGTYKELAKDGKITNEDVDGILKSKWGTGHNHMLTYNEKNWKIFIVESLGFVDNTLEIDYETLVYAVKKGLYGDNARTLLPDSDNTEKIIFYLRQLQAGADSGELLVQAHEKEKSFVIKATRLHIMPLQQMIV